MSISNANKVLKMEENEGRIWDYDIVRGQYYLYNKDLGYWSKKKEEYLQAYVRKQLRSIHRDLDKKHNVTETVSAIKHHLISLDSKKKYNYNLKYINMKNGMLDWQSDKLHHHNASYYSFFQMNLEYDRNAECPRWERALSEWLPDNKSRMFLQEYIGYCLIPDTSYHKAVILLGEGKNGKSTFLKVIERLFGEHILSNIPLHRISDRFETAYLQDKLINICSDIDPKYLTNVGIIKTLIAGEKIRGEYKGGNSFDFKPIVRLLFSANEIPKSIDKSYAWYRRFEIVEFPNRFEDNCDPLLEEKLLAELPGIFNWALEGLIRLKGRKKFTISNSMHNSMDEYQIENDSIKAFLGEITIDDEEGFIKVTDCYNKYKQYCKSGNLKIEKKALFGRRLSKLGYSSDIRYFNGKSHRCYIGLELVDA
ncbi:MAG: DNA primase family protein [Halanaerobiales bacterium]